MTGAAVERIDLDGFGVTLVPLRDGEPLSVGRHPDSGVRLVSSHVAETQCRFVADGDGWALEDVAAAGGTWLNGRRVARQRLQHGDTVWLGETLLVFLSQRPAHDAALEAHIDARPDDEARLRVWADWLLERGDAFGEHLLSATPLPIALEGLGPLVDAGRVELEWRHGLVRAARVRCIDDATYSSIEVLARVVALRAARWLESLTADLFTWVTPSDARLQLDVPLALRGLATGPALPRLRRLSLGYVTGPPTPSRHAAALVQRIAQRSPALDARLEAVLPLVRRAFLRVEATPAGGDFYGPTLDDGRLALDDGLWVGAATPGALRALAPGVHRHGVGEAFLVRQEPPRWCLVPVASDLRLNGRPAVATRLLPGDVIETAEGARFRFELGEAQVSP